jgi:hypothetical protein
LGLILLKSTTIEIVGWGALYAGHPFKQFRLAQKEGIMPTIDYTPKYNDSNIAYVSLLNYLRDQGYLFQVFQATTEDFDEIVRTNCVQLTVFNIEEVNQYQTQACVQIFHPDHGYLGQFWAMTPYVMACSYCESVTDWQMVSNKPEANILGERISKWFSEYRDAWTKDHDENVN